jgi:hypothetical protein
MSIWIGIKIWGRVILINAAFWFAGSLLFGEPKGILMAVFFLFGGFVFTMPLLILIIPLVYISCRLPYNFHSRLSWLAFYLLVLAGAFFLLMALVLNDDFFGFRKIDFLFTVVAGIWILLSVWLSRS